MTESEADIWALTYLSHLFVPERIPDIIRRNAPVFDGRRAIDLMMEGREMEVEQAYESCLGFMDSFWLSDHKKA